MKLIPNNTFEVDKHYLVYWGDCNFNVKALFFLTILELHPDDSGRYLVSMDMRRERFCDVMVHDPESVVWQLNQPSIPYICWELTESELLMNTDVL